MTRYIAEVICPEKKYRVELLYDGSDLEAALDIARKEQRQLNMFDTSGYYVTLDRYEDGKLAEAIDFMQGVKEE